MARRKEYKRTAKFCGDCVSCSRKGKTSHFTCANAKTLRYGKHLRSGKSTLACALFEKRKTGLPTKTGREDTNYTPETRLHEPILSFKKQVTNWRGELMAALEDEGKRQGLSPMERVAKAFFSDDDCMKNILKHMLPQLKSVDAKVEQESPFKLIIDMSPGRDEEKKEDEE